MRLPASSIATLCLVAAGLVVCTETVFAQRAVTLRGEATCSRCDVTLAQPVLLRGADSLGNFSPSPTLRRLSDGRFIAVNYQVPGVLQIVGPDGSLQRQVGRAGGGPFEFQQIASIERSLGDTIIIYDNGNARVTRLSPTLQLLGEAPAPGRVQTGLHLGADRYVVNAPVISPNGSAQLLHVVNRTGTIRSFGTVTGVTRASVSGKPVWRQIARSPSDNTIWTAQTTSYVLEQWDTAGTRRAVLTRDASWFQSYDEEVRIDPEHPPQPWIRAVELDQSGLIWVMISVPDPRYREGLEALPQQVNGITIHRLRDAATIWDTVIEVIDPATGQVLTSKSFANAFIGFADPDHVFEYIQDDDDVGHYRVVRIALTGRGQ